MSGIQEILLVVLLILALLIVPRMLPSKRQPTAPRPLKVKKAVRISGKMRLALLLSFLWLFVFSAIYMPWGEQWLQFLYVGVGPLIMAWGLYWVMKGFRRHRRR